MNRQVTRYLVKAAGKDGIDEMDNANGSTVLHLACLDLTDLQIVEAIVEGGGNVNCVNNDNYLPLKLIELRLEEDPDNEVLDDIQFYLKRKGAVNDWRKEKLLEVWKS